MRKETKTLDEALRRYGALTELADKLGVTPQYICEIRKGRKTPSLELAVEIARETGVPVESLIRRAA